MIDFFPSRTEVLVIGDYTIRWYGLLYVIAFWLAWYVLQRIQSYRSITLTPDQWAYVTASLAAGVLVGGRLGYVLFYEPTYYLQNPTLVLSIWEGGMSSHGGFTGVLVASFFIARIYKINWLSLLDILTVPAAIGLALGRIGNFINQELYGVITTLPWGIDVPDATGKRHPTQIYATIKNGTIAMLSLYLLQKTRFKPGQVTAVAIILYSILRFLIEFVRVQPWEYTWGLTRGQLLTIPLCLVGIWLWQNAKKYTA